MKKIVLLILLYIANISYGQDIIRLYIQADSLLTIGKKSQAILLLKQIASRTNDPYIKEQAIIVALNNHDFNNAQEIINTVKSNKKELYLAWLYTLKAQPDSSIAHLRKYLGSTPKIPKYKITEDTILLKLSQYPQWKKLWQKQWYDSLDLYLDQLAVQAQYGDEIETLKNLEKLKKQFPNNPNIFRLEAVCYKRLKAYPQAIENLKKSIKNGLEKYPILIEISRLYRQAEDYRAAADMLETAYKLRPYQIELIPEIANTYTLAGNYEKAIFWLKKYLSYRQTEQIQFQLAKIYYLKEDYLSAISQINSLIKRNPNNYQYLTLRGKSYYRTNNFDRAYYDLTMSLDLNPIQPQLYYLIGQSAYFIGHKQEACLYWQRSYETFHDPNAKDKLEKFCKK